MVSLTVVEAEDIIINIVAATIRNQMENLTELKRVGAIVNN